MTKTPQSERKPRVTHAGEWGSFTFIPDTRLEEVEQVLNAHHVRYEVEDFTISVDDEPEMVKLSFDPGQDVDSLQAIFDRLP